MLHLGHCGLQCGKHSQRFGRSFVTNAGGGATKRGTHASHPSSDPIRGAHAARCPANQCAHQSAGTLADRSEEQSIEEKGENPYQYKCIKLYQ